jgi:hypothetical protein
MHAIRIETTIDENGELRLTKLPFKAGEAVEVVVSPRNKNLRAADHMPLRGLSIQYERPTDPVAEEDWSALR